MTYKEITEGEKEIFMNKGKVLKIFKDIHKSNTIRYMAVPFISIKRKIEVSTFKNTIDAQYIRRFKNTHMGERCFIIGNGPSLTGTDLDMIRDEFSFACNRIYNIFDQTEWRPQIYLCLDRQCLFDEMDNIRKLDGCEKFVSAYARKYGRKEEDHLHYLQIWGRYEPVIERLYMESVSEDVSIYVSTSQTVTCNAIEFAIYMGFKNIYLLGVDHNYPISIDKNGKKTVDNSIKSHFNNGGSKESSLHYIYNDAATACYQTCEDYARKHNINIFNATRGGKLEVFRRVKLEDIINTIIED